MALPSLPTLVSKLRRGGKSGSLFGLFASAGKLQVTRVVSTVVSAVQIAVVARYLSTAQYGTYGLILNTIIVIQGVFDVRSNEMIMRFFFEFRKHGEDRFAGAVLVAGGLFEAGVSLVSALIILALNGLLAKMLLKDAASSNLFIVAALVPLSNIGSGLAAAILSIERSYGRLAIADSVSICIGFLLTLAILPFHASVATLLSMSLLTQFLKAILRWAFLWKSDSPTKRLFVASVRDRQCLRDLKPHFRRISRFGFSNNLLALLKIAQGSLPTFAIGILRSPADVAFFFLGQRIGARLAAFLMPITDVAYREAAEERHSGGIARRLRSLRHAFFIISAIVVPVILVLAVGGRWVIPFVFGKQYSNGVLSIQLTVLAFAMACLVNPLQSLLLIEGKATWITVGFAIGLALQMALIAVYVPAYASLGASISLLGFQVLLTVVMMIGANRLLENLKRESPTPTGVQV